MHIVPATLIFIWIIWLFLWMYHRYKYSKKSNYGKFEYYLNREVKEPFSGFIGGVEFITIVALILGFFVGGGYLITLF